MKTNIEKTFKHAPDPTNHFQPTAVCAVFPSVPNEIKKKKVAGLFLTRNSTINVDGTTPPRSQGRKGATARPPAEIGDKRGRMRRRVLKGSGKLQRAFRCDIRFGEQNLATVTLTAHHLKLWLSACGTWLVFAQCEMAANGWPNNVFFFKFLPIILLGVFSM